MLLHWSPRSPFVRKVMIVAHETGLADRIDCRRTVVAATQPNAALMRENPLNKLPTLIRDDGTALYDSAVICEYLDGLHAGPRLIPAEREAYFTALRRAALGDGLLDLLILWRYERARTHPDPAHLAACAVKADACLAVLEDEAEALAATPFGIGHVALGCALSYVDFRFPELAWRTGRPRLAAWYAGFAQRPSARATELRDG
ncbi:glutathione S-transferase [Rhodoplanes sp. TEM]|uniref:Glutathione S-transferase n=1 Tax=Rhodoplanes tepidamans TaxID=200616 RepID=A0ABT5JBW9_RHOTP|nr:MULTISPECIES: glutathione S-transferase [Rhodoplanes]MDC7787107.1 glutathione S-transferase [Rhodoplanes tepidamans]MDC7987878.1 glutathione S-transferase [Rhodoplanes sp. TEM]MDQ0358707.1 glutathione S-transferase [Rhodoplanes tepidamans]